MKTIQDIRDSFWTRHPQFQDEFRTKKRQKDYREEICSAFDAHVESLSRSGIITERLAGRATL